MRRGNSGEDGAQLTLHHGTDDGGEKHLHSIKGQERDTAHHHQTGKGEILVEIAVANQRHVGQAYHIDNAQACKTGENYTVGRGVLACYATNNPCGGDEGEDKAEGGLQHIAKAATHGEDGQPQKTQRHIDPLAHGAPFSAQ